MRWRYSLLARPRRFEDSTSYSRKVASIHGATPLHMAALQGDKAVQRRMFSDRDTGGSADEWGEGDRGKKWIEFDVSNMCFMVSIVFNIAMLLPLEALVKP